MRDPIGRECTLRHNETVGAHDAEHAHAQLIRAGAVVAVQEHDLGDCVPQLYGFEPAPKTYDVPRVHRTRLTRPRLPCGDRHKPGAHEPGQHPLGRNERVLGTRAYMSRWCEHGGGPQPHILERQGAAKDIG
jgi:hypothetical protein